MIFTIFLLMYSCVNEENPNVKRQERLVKSTIKVSGKELHDMDTIRIVIVEDDLGWIKALTSFLNEYEKFCIVGTAGNKDEATELARAVKPDVILTDINLSGNKRDGINAAVEILKFSQTKIIMMTSITDEDIVVDCFTAGAVYYILKERYKEIPDAIFSVLNDKYPLNALLKEYSRLKREEQIINLSPSEKKVFSLLESGYSRKSIEKTLFISGNTLKTQIRGIITKLEVRNIKEAINKVKTRGLLDKGR